MINSIRIFCNELISVSTSCPQKHSNHLQSHGSNSLQSTTKLINTTNNHMMACFPTNFDRLFMHEFSMRLLAISPMMKPIRPVSRFNPMWSSIRPLNLNRTSIRHSATHSRISPLMDRFSHDLISRSDLACKSLTAC